MAEILVVSQTPLETPFSYTLKSTQTHLLSTIKTCHKTFRFINRQTDKANNVARI